MRYTILVITTSNLPNPFPDWLTTQSAAKISGLSASMIRKLSLRGEIEAVRIGRDWLIQVDSLHAYTARMASMSLAERRNPWRADLAERGRGRKRATN